MDRRYDAYEQYEAGLHALLNHIHPRHPRYREAVFYQQRLRENIAVARKGGDSELHRAERGEMVNRLNEVALTTLGISFAELCELNTLPEPPEQRFTLSLVAKVVAVCLILAFLVASLAPAVPTPAPAPTPVPTRTPTPTPMLL